MDDNLQKASTPEPDNTQAETKEEKLAFYKTLAKMVFPLAFQNLMSAAVNASDAVMLGMVEQSALSAVSLAGQIHFIFTLFMTVVTLSTTILAAQYWGKGNRKAVEEIFGFSTKISFLISLLFFLATSFLPEQLMRIFTSEQILIGYGADYLKIMSFSFIFVGISQVYLCIMKNTGRTTKSTVVGSSAMILNVILNFVFIFGLDVLGIPAMGIKGAAIATVFARLIECVWAVAESFRKNYIRLKPAYLIKINPTLRNDYFKNALPVLMNYIVWGVGFTMYTVIMGHMGSDAVAANSIANIMKNIVICVCSGISTAGSILVGNELGRGNIKRGILLGGRITKLALISGAISGLILLALSPVIINLVDLSDTSREYLFGMLLMCSYYMIGKSVNSTTIGGVFCAGGDAKFGFYCDSVVMWLIMVPAGLIAAFVLHLPVLAVYFILSLDEFIKLPVMYIHYKKYGWAKDLTRSTEV